MAKHKDVAEKFYNVLGFFEKSHNPPNLDTKKLKGKQNHYRLRLGKYRFLYEVQKDKVIIYFYEAVSRGGVY